MTLIKDITQDNFEQEVLNAQGTVLVDFYAPWCGPCKTMMPVLDALKERLGDKINILNASLLAMKRAILNLPIKPTKILVDGIHKPDLDIEMEVIIGGDSLIKQISAASIIAKVYRDNLMYKFDKKFSVYGFKNNKGYGTKQHYSALEINGHSTIHRRTFKGVLKR